MQSRSRRQTEPPHVARVRRNLRLNQNNIKHSLRHSEQMRQSGSDRGISNYFLRSSLFLLLSPPSSPLRSPLFASCYRSFSATSFSSFTTSAANLRIPSAVFSVAIALSFTRYLNFFSSSSSRSIFADFAFSGLSF